MGPRSRFTTATTDPLEDVRIELRELLPSLCHFYGLKPWEVEQMPRVELEVFVRQLREYQEEAKRQNG